jgi:hypothetical protein
MLDILQQTIRRVQIVDPADAEAQIFTEPVGAVIREAEWEASED